jgi:phosphoesterase RecJ-like protein
VKTISNKKLLEAILKAESVAVITHIHPDADAIGSMLAICHIIKQLNKKAVPYCQDPVPKQLMYLPYSDTVRTPDSYKNDADLIISIDASDKERIGAGSKIFDSNPNTVQIDHHVTNTRFAKINEVDIKVAASGMLVFRLAKALNVKIDDVLAQLLYAAISGDTGNFCFPSVTAETFYQMGELMEAGLDLAFNAQQIHLINTEGKLRITCAALSTLAFHMGGKFTSMHLYQKDFANCMASREESDGIVNLGLYIPNVKAAYLATEQEDGIKFSLRCLEPYDISSVAKKFGGGGHRLASGCSINDSVENAMLKMNAAIADMLKN